MSRRKEPAIPNELLDQLLAGGAASAAFDQGGLLDSLKKALTERALNAEMDHHLAGDEGVGNTRNGYGRKTVMTDTGKLAIDVPRDRQASFDPQLIAKYQRRFPGFDEKIVSMYARGMSIGTNVHELPMVLAALADGDEAVAATPYRVLEDWRRHYGGNLLIVLPDAFGTAAFLASAPDWVADWTGFRPDSAPPIAGGEEIIRWWQAHGRDPKAKLLIFSDGMDVDTIEATYRHFDGRVRMSFGWGTNLTNDFRGCMPDGAAGLEPISLVAKVTSANGRPAVKLSDNPAKATGDAAEIARYPRIFGTSGRTEAEVSV